MPELCPCGSGLAYNACCAPFISGNQPAPTPGQLMRSRFTAYVSHNVDYLIGTPTAVPKRGAMQSSTVLRIPNGWA